MSTKLYEAYRIPRSKFDEFILTFNRICFDAIREFVLSIDVQPNVISIIRKDLSANDYSDKDISLIWTLIMAKEMSERGYNDVLNLDCSFNVWFQGRWAYIQPFVLNTLDLKARYPKRKWFENADYGYWNNTDKPDRVSDNEWEERENVWNDIAFEDWHRTRLTHVVLEMKSSRIGLHHLLKTINADEAWQYKILLVTGWYKLTGATR